MTAVLKAATGPTNSRTLWITCWTASSLVTGFAVVENVNKTKIKERKEQFKNKRFHSQEFQVQYGTLYFVTLKRNRFKRYPSVLIKCHHLLTTLCWLSSHAISQVSMHASWLLRDRLRNNIVPWAFSSTIFKMAEKVPGTNKRSAFHRMTKVKEDFDIFFLVLNSVQKFETFQGPANFGSPTFANVTKEIMKRDVSTERRTFVDDNKSNWHVTFDRVFLSNTGCVNHKI